MMDRLRIWWAVLRYELWLDLHHVPGRVRRGMARDLRANLTDAARSVGATKALGNLGSLRGLARSEAHDGDLRSPWLAGLAAFLTAFASLVAVFFLLSLYYVEGVLDSGVTEPVSGSLFPFIGSSVTVENSSAGGLAFEMAPGPFPLVLAVVVFILVAKPWRTLRRSSATAIA